MSGLILKMKNLRIVIRMSFTEDLEKEFTDYYQPILKYKGLLILLIMIAVPILLMLALTVVEGNSNGIGGI